MNERNQTQEGKTRTRSLLKLASLHCVPQQFRPACSVHLAQPSPEYWASRIDVLGLLHITDIGEQNNEQQY